MEEFFTSFGKYNFWNNNTPKLGYLRNDYLNKIFQFCNNSLVKVLVGQRRTGKSYLLRQIANQLIETGVQAQNIFYNNKEFIELKDYKDLDELIKRYQKVLKVKVYLFVI